MAQLARVTVLSHFGKVMVLVMMKTTLKDVIGMVGIAVGLLTKQSGAL